MHPFIKGIQEKRWKKKSLIHQYRVRKNHTQQGAQGIHLAISVVIVR